jgi:hypothetical protein
MGLKQIRLKWRKFTLVLVLSVAAGLAGYKTELMAGSTQYMVSGQSVHAHWSGWLAVSSGNSDMDITASSQVTGPGKPNPVTTMFVNGNTFNWGNNWPYDTVWTALGGSGDIDPSTLKISVRGNGADGSVTATVPATYQVETWNNGTTWTSVNATVNVSLSSGQVFQESTRNFSHYHDVSHLMGGGGASSTGWLSSNFSKSQTSVNATGSGGVSLNDGVNPPFDYVPQNTSTAWGEVRDQVSGSHNVSN